MMFASEPARHRHFSIQPARGKTSSATATAGEATNQHSVTRSHASQNA
jgi:hypothetical protein